MIALDVPVTVKSATQLDVVSIVVVRKPMLSVAITYQLYDEDGAEVGVTGMVGIDYAKAEVFMRETGDSIEDRARRLVVEVLMAPKPTFGFEGMLK